jgi:hypothetical protein
MKKVAKFIAFCVGITSFISCEKHEYELVNKLSGGWKVTKLTYQVANGDSVVTRADLGQFNFSRCQWHRESDNRCDGWYRISGQNQISFGYNTVENDKSMNVYIRNLPKQSDYASQNEFLQAQATFWGGNQPNLNGPWKIKVLTDNTAQIEGSALLGYLGERTTKTAPLVIEMSR